jgi:putative MATE family efflux protein
MVIRIALPAVVTMLLQTVNGLMDMFFVGHLPQGRDALAATGIGGSMIFLMISCAMGVATGTMALVARFTGAQVLEDSRYAMGQSLTLGTLIGFALGIGLYLGRTPVVNLLLNGKEDPIAAQLCNDFLSMALLATLPIFLINILQSAFRGLGDTQMPMYITSAMIGVHIFLNWLLIYGNMGMPRLEVKGAGIAFALSQVIGVALFFWAMIRKSPLSAALQWHYLRPQKEWIWRILRIGIPSSVQNLVRVFSMMSFNGMLARTGEGAAAVAALQIGIRTEGIAFMPGFGYSVSASALVGQSLGAKQPERAERFAWVATQQAIAVMTFMAVIFFLGASPIAKVFTNDTTVQHLGVEYLRLNAFCEPFLALGMVLSGALSGAGDTVYPTYITIFTMIVLRLSLAYLLMFSLNYGSYGAWLTMGISTIIGGILTALLFRLGRWKQIKV